MPTYNLEAPNGKTYHIEGPEGASREEVIQAILARDPGAAVEPTVLGYAKEAVKAIPRGFMSGLEQAATGAAALLPEEYEKPVVAKAQELAERFSPKVAPGYEDAITTKLGEGLGSMGTFIVPGGLPARTLMAGAMGAGEARQRAQQAGATPEQISEATAQGILPGLTDIVPVERLINGLGKTVIKGYTTRLVRMAETGGLEGAQEMAQNIGQNLIAQGYNPEQGTFTGTGEAGAYGAGVGAIAQGLMDLAFGRRAPSTRNRVDQSNAPIEAIPQAPIEAIPQAPVEEVTKTPLQDGVAAGVQAIGAATPAAAPVVPAAAAPKITNPVVQVQVDALQAQFDKREAEIADMQSRFKTLSPKDRAYLKNKIKSNAKLKAEIAALKTAPAVPVVKTEEAAAAPAVVKTEVAAPVVKEEEEAVVAGGISAEDALKARTAQLEADKNVAIQKGIADANAEQLVTDTLATSPDVSLQPPAPKGGTPLATNGTGVADIVNDANNAAEGEVKKPVALDLKATVVEPDAAEVAKRAAAEAEKLAQLAAAKPKRVIKKSEAGIAKELAAKKLADEVTAKKAADKKLADEAAAAKKVAEKKKAAKAAAVVPEEEEDKVAQTDEAISFAALDTEVDPEKYIDHVAVLLDTKSGRELLSTVTEGTTKEGMYTVSKDDIAKATAINDNRKRRNKVATERDVVTRHEDVKDRLSDLEESAARTDHTAKEVADVLRKEFGDTSGFDKLVTVHQTESDLLAAYPEIAEHRDYYPGVRGVAHKGRVHLVADQIERGQELGVFLHEAGAHLGFDRLEKEGSLDRKFLVDQVYKWAAGDDMKAEVAQVAIAKGINDDEIIAYTIEGLVTNGVTPTGFRLESTWLRKIMAAFQTLLNKLGMRHDITPQELVDLAAGAAHITIESTATEDIAMEVFAEPKTRFEEGGKANWFRALRDMSKQDIERHDPIPIGAYGPVRNAGIIFRDFKEKGATRFAAIEVVDMDAPAGLPFLDTHVDTFSLTPSDKGPNPSWADADIGTSGPLSTDRTTYVQKKYKAYLYHSQGYVKWQHDIVGSQNVRLGFRTLREWANKVGVLDDVQAVHFIRRTGANSGREVERTFLRDEFMRFSKPKKTSAPSVEVNEKTGMVDAAGIALEKKRINWSDTSAEPFIKGIQDNPIYHASYKGIRADMVQMSPDEYLRLANQYTSSNYLHDIKLKRLRKAVQDGKTISLPYLSFSSELEVTAQEGRHRAALAKEMGLTSIPVMVTTKTKPNYKLESQWKAGKISDKEARKSLGLDTPSAANAYRALNVRATEVENTATKRDTPRFSQSGEPGAKGSTVYHVVLTDNVATIQKKGLLPMQPSNWVKAGSKERYGAGEIYAFENKVDAVKWAAKWDWSRNQKFGSGKVSLLEVKSPGGWVVDDADPLGQAGARGAWLKRMGAIPAANIETATPVTMDLVREASRLAEKQNQVKSVFNENPTDNPDIRFSQSNPALAAGMGTAQQLFKGPSAPMGLIDSAVRTASGVRQSMANKLEWWTDKATRVYGNLATDATGEASMRDRIEAASKVTHIALSKLMLGGLRKEKGFWEAYKTDHSYQDILNKLEEGVGKYAETPDFESMNKAFNMAATARREFELIKDKQMTWQMGKVKGEVNPTLDVNTQAKGITPQMDAGMRIYNEVPEIKEALAIFEKFNNDGVKQLVIAGVIDQDTADMLMGTTGYVPWFREADDAEGNIKLNALSPSQFTRGLINKSNLRELEGRSAEDAQISNVLNNMAKLSGWMTSKTVGNDTAAYMVDFATKFGVAGKPFAKKVGMGQPNSVLVLENGVPTYYAFDDPMALPAFRGYESAHSAITQFLSAPANLVRAGVTAFPVFSISQLPQDAMRAFIDSDLKNPYALIPRILKNFVVELVGGGTESGKTLSKFGIVGRGGDIMPGEATRSLRRRLGHYDTGMGGTARKFWDGLEKIQAASDAASRTALYELTMKETKSKAFPDGNQALAIRKAREIINFDTQGSSGYSTFLRQTVPFMGVSMIALNNLYKGLVLGQRLSDKEASAAKRTIIYHGTQIAVLTMLYTMLVGDTEDYKKLSDSERNRNFIIPGTGLSIPVPGDGLGFMFKVIPEQIARYTLAEGLESKDAGSKAGRALYKGLTNIGSFESYIPVVGSPLPKTFVELVLNENWYTGNAIVGKSKEHLEPWQQYTDSTSEIAKQLGLALNLSPLKLDYVVRAMTGQLGGFTFAMTEAAMNAAQGKVTPSWDIRTFPGLSAFTYPSGKDRAALEDFYELRERVDVVARTYSGLATTGKGREALAYLAEGDNKRAYALRQFQTEAEKGLAKFRAARTLILIDPNIKTGEEMKQRLKELDDRENAYLKSMRLPDKREFAYLTPKFDPNILKAFR